MVSNKIAFQLSPLASEFLLCTELVFSDDLLGTGEITDLGLATDDTVDADGNLSSFESNEKCRNTLTVTFYYPNLDQI